MHLEEHLKWPCPCQPINWSKNTNFKRSSQWIRVHMWQCSALISRPWCAAISVMLNYIFVCLLAWMANNKPFQKFCETFLIVLGIVLQIQAETREYLTYYMTLPQRFTGFTVFLLCHKPRGHINWWAWSLVLYQQGYYQLQYIYIHMSSHICSATLSLCLCFCLSANSLAFQQPPPAFFSLSL